MSDYKDKTALVWDNGLFVHIALKLAESFGKVYYGGNYVNAFPKSNFTLPGDGLDNITRILDFWRHVDEADLIVFPDVMYADMQKTCEGMGKRVFGARDGELLELQRWHTKEFLKSIDMPVAESHLIRGMEPLRRFLQERSGKWWVKTSRFRGDFETFNSEDYELVKPKLDELEYAMGRKALVYPFVVEADIEAVLEVGYDGFTIDGQFPGDNDQSLFGIEEKDVGYVGVAKKYAQLPEPVRWVNSKLQERLRAERYRGLFSSEVRCQSGEEELKGGGQFEDCPYIFNPTTPVGGFRSFLTDPCCRAASPPSELYVEWIGNWADIMWQGAEGVFVPAEPVARYGVEVMIHSSWADKGWQPVQFPEAIRPFIKLRNHCRIEDVDCAVPQSYGLPEVGAVIAMGDTLDEAIAQVQERCAQVSGYYLECKTHAIPEVIDKIETAQESGIDFTHDELPTPNEVQELAPK